MLCRSLDPTLGLRVLFFMEKDIYLLFGFCVFFTFIFVTFLLHFRPDFRPDFVPISSRFHPDFVPISSRFRPDFGSDNLISLSYSLPVFSANLFGLFLIWCGWLESGQIGRSLTGRRLFRTCRPDLKCVL